MANCVNPNTEEFKNLLKETNMNSVILAAKVSLWQDINGLDKYPTVEDIKNKDSVEFSTLGSNITSDSDFLAEEFQSFRNSYHTKEEIKLAAELISSKIKDAVGTKATSYEIKTSKTGLVERVIINPTAKRDAVQAVNNNTLNVKGRIQGIAHSSYTNSFAKIVSQVGNPYLNNIKIIYPNDLIQAFAEGKEHISLQEFQEYMYERFLESKGNFKSIVKSQIDAQQELDYLKTLPHSQFQGFYNLQGELITDIEAWRNYLSEAANEENMLEDDYEEFSTLGDSSQQDAVIIDPNYEVYLEKKKAQVKRVEFLIQNAETASRVETKTEEEKKLHQRKVFYFKNILTALEKDLKDLEKTSNYFETVESIFYRDIALAEELLKTPNIENFFLAEDITEFIKVNMAYQEPFSKMFALKTSGQEKFEEKVYKLIEEVNGKNNLLISEVNKARDNYFFNILTKYENNIKDLYPGKTLAEIKEILKENLKDISWGESNLLTQGKNLWTESDVLAELMRLELDFQIESAKPSAQRLIQRINGILPRVEKELEKLGYVTVVGVKGKKGITNFSFYNYNALFYRKDEKGNTLSTLVSKFTDKWERFENSVSFEFKNRVKDARQEQNWVELDQILKEKYFTLENNVDFIDFTLLSDVAKEFPEDADLFSPDDVYTQRLKDLIGDAEYKTIVETQIKHLRNFNLKKEALLKSALKREGVETYEELSENAKSNIKISTSRYSPFEFLKSLDTTEPGLIVFEVGTQKNAKYSYLEYNTYIPKRETFQKEDTGYFDKNFEIIETTPALKEFWEAAEETLYLTNHNLLDSVLKLRSNTILHLKKSFWENSVDKGLFETFKSLPSKGTLDNTVQFFKDAMSAKESTKKGEVIKLPSLIASFEDLVTEDFDMVKMELATVLKIQLNNDTELDWKGAPTAIQELILEVLGLNAPSDFTDNVKLSKKGTFKVRDLKTFSRNNVMEQQTLDLPSLLKALVEQSTLHKARTIAKNNIDILRGIDKNKIQPEEKGVRTNAQKRTDYFYNKAVLNQPQEELGNISQKRIKKGSQEDKYVNNQQISPEEHFLYLHQQYKNFSLEEKIQFNTILKRWDFVNSVLNDPNLKDEERQKYEEEKAGLKQRVTLMGKDYMASSIYSSVINKGLSIGVGLGYATLGMVFNYLNARNNFFHRDGEFWTEGNAFPAFAFVDMYMTRKFNPTYAKEWGVMEAFVHQLDLVQDGTNDLQKSEKTAITSAPKIYNLKRWGKNPMYGTELIEWYNQVPIILAMSADVKIKNPTTGEEVPIFDGLTFPAHTRDANTGELKLKPEFRSPENIEDYENFSSTKMVLWKVKVNNAIRSVNGDYSVTGVIKGKENIFGQSALMFKTWAGEYYYSRWAVGQKNVALGKTQDGFIIGSLLDPNTKKLATGMLLGNVVAGALMTPFLSTGLAILGTVTVVGVVTGGIYSANRYFKNRVPLAENMAQQEVASAISVRQMALYALKATTVGTLQIPVNKAWSIVRLIAGSATGKLPEKQTLINIDATFNGNLDERASNNLRNLTKLYQMSNTRLLIAILTQMLLGGGDDEEEEKKGEPGSEQEKRYLKQQERKEEFKFVFNAIKNINQREFDELNLGNSVFSTLNLIGSENITGRTSPLQKVSQLTYDTAEAALSEETERYNKPGSMYHGDAKWVVRGRKTVLPQFFKNMGKGEWLGGLEIVGNEEYQKNDLIDELFETDYKIYKKEQKQVRAQMKLRKEEEMAQSKFNKDYTQLSPKEKLEIERDINSELKKMEGYEYRERKEFDENQQEK